MSIIYKEIETVMQSLPTTSSNALASDFEILNNFDLLKELNDLSSSISKPKTIINLPRMPRYEMLKTYSIQSGSSISILRKQK